MGNDFDEIYSETFDAIIDKVKGARSFTIYEDENNFRVKFKAEKILSVGDSPYKAMQVIESSERDAEKQFGEMFKRILTKKGHKVMDYNTGPLEHFPISFCLKENSETIAFLFLSDLSNMEYYIGKFAKSKTTINRLCFVMLYDPSSWYANGAFLFGKGTKPDSFKAVRSYKDMFDDYVGADEYEFFYKRLKEFEPEYRKAIGYSTFTMPESDVMLRFKLGMKKVIIDFDYSGLRNGFDSIAEVLTDDEYATLRFNFERTGVYKLITYPDIGGCFISSEFLRQTNATSNYIDNSGIIMGYAKSVEVALTRIVRNLEGQGIKLFISGKGNVEFTSETKDEIFSHITLDALINALNTKRNWEKLSPAADTRKIINKYLLLFKEKRNTYFHKTQTDSAEDVEYMRKLVLLIHFLLHGTIKDS